MENTTLQTLDLSKLRKQRVKIDLGDDKDHILEINTSDMSVITRLQTGYTKLMELQGSIGKFEDLPDIDKVTPEEFERVTTSVANKLQDVDSQMRNAIDTIFDANVSSVCAPYGSMYDLIDGVFRFEYIIEGISGLYADNISSEIKKVRKRIQSHTNKYTKKYM